MKQIGKILVAFVGIGLAVFLVQGCSTQGDSAQLAPETLRSLKVPPKAGVKAYGIINIVKAAEPTATPSVMLARDKARAKRSGKPRTVTGKSVGSGSQPENTDFWLYFDTGAGGATLSNVPVAAFPANMKFVGSYPVFQTGEVLTSDYLQAGSGYFTGQGTVPSIAAASEEGRGQIKVKVKTDFRNELSEYEGILFVVATKESSGSEFDDVGLYFLKVLAQ